VILGKELKKGDYIRNEGKVKKYGVPGRIGLGIDK
jgi:hypothetical protein